MSRISGVLFAALACAARPSIAGAQGKRDRSQNGFTTVERETIAAYFSQHAIEVKPLPPGIVKRLERGKALPPGIAKRQLPESLLEELPHREDEGGVALEVTIFGDRVVLLDASGLVVDVLVGIFGGFSDSSACSARCTSVSSS